MRALCLGLVVLVAGCAPATSRTEFLRGFEPSTQVIHKFERIRHVPYVPRVAARGVAAVHRAVNAVSYRKDGPDGGWDPPVWFWAHGGDCEEYALTKGAELAAQGFDHLYLTVVRERATGAAHAVLVVEDGGAMVVLDNQERGVIAWSQAKQRYRAEYAVALATGNVLVARDAESPEGGAQPLAAAVPAVRKGLLRSGAP